MISKIIEINLIQSIIILKKRLDSVSGYCSSKYEYDKNGRLISILVHREEIEKDSSVYNTFEYNAKNFIVLERNELDSTSIKYEYYSENEINILMSKCQVQFMYILMTKFVNT